MSDGGRASSYKSWMIGLVGKLGFVVFSTTIPTQDCLPNGMMTIWPILSLVSDS